MLLGCAGTRRRGEGPGEGGTGITGRWHVMLHFNRSHQERTHPFGLGVTSCYSTPLLNPTQPLGTLLASLLSPAFLSSCVGCFSPPIYKPCGMCHFHFFFSLHSVPGTRRRQLESVSQWSTCHPWIKREVVCQSGGYKKKMRAKCERLGLARIILISLPIEYRQRCKGTLNPDHSCLVGTPSPFHKRKRPREHPSGLVRRHQYKRGKKTVTYVR